MAKIKWLVLGMLFWNACKNSDAEIKILDQEVDKVLTNQHVDSTKTIKLKFNPPDGALIYYSSENETNYLMELNEKETKSAVSSKVQYHYKVRKDSSRGFLMSVAFDSIKVITQKDEQVADADAARAPLSTNPIDKMLGVLLEQPLQVNVNSLGIVTSVRGYEELGQRFLEKFADDDQFGKTVAKEQYDKVVTNGLVKGQVNQIFKALPDSLIYEGFSWKLTEKLDGELPLNMFTTLKIKSIDPDGQIVIVSSAVINSQEEVILEVPGQRNVTAKLSGNRKGILILSAKTGTVERIEYHGDLKGTILAFGNLVPVTIKNKIKLERLNFTR